MASGDGSNGGSIKLKNYSHELSHSTWEPFFMPKI